MYRHFLERCRNNGIGNSPIARYLFAPILELWETTLLVLIRLEFRETAISRAHSMIELSSDYCVSTQIAMCLFNQGADHPLIEARVNIHLNLALVT